ncbi:MAG: UDP-N-acetylmuramoyl-L-alanine--D-glutamate ligase, partial [Gammaproteobacteria bacterium]
MKSTEQFRSHRPKGHESPRSTLIVGLGASGLAAARHLAGRGESVRVIDSRAEPPALEPLRSEQPEVPVALGTLDTRWLDGVSRVVLSPGLSVDLPLIVEARNRGIEITGELELFARAAVAPVLAVTGSNGKSTVTSLASAVLEAQGFDAPAGGNLGPPALDLLELGRVDVYVLEVSSFQLETTHSLRPLAAALLNISPDHIDRHGSLARYAALKASLLECAERAIVNWDDPLVREVAPRAAETIPFSVVEPLARGWSVIEQDRERWLAQDLKPLIPSSALAQPGRIAEANALAALALASALGGDPGAAAEVLSQFAGLPHRMQPVREVRGVEYVDDSKGTNVGATVAALLASAKPTVLIAGGLAKGADFGPLADAANGRLRAAVLLGEAASELEAALGSRTRTIIAKSMQAAVETAA